MRVTQQSIGRQLIYQINRNFGRMNDLRVQVSSGKRVNDYDDDPRAVDLIKRFDSLQSYNEQYLRNASSARNFLEATDSALQSMSQALIDLRQVIQQELGPLSSPISRKAAVEAVRGKRDEVLALANQKIQGSYLFGGYRSDREPFSILGDTVTYNGDDNVPTVQLGPTLRMPVSVAGSEFMGADSAVLAGSEDLRPRIRPTTALSELNGGSGVASGFVEIRAGGGPAVTVDLSGAATVQDVLDAINGSGAGVTASITPGEDGLQLDGLGPIAVGEVLGGTVAADLGLLGSTTGDSYLGDPISPALTETTPFSEIADFDGELPLGTLRIRVADTVTDVDLSAATDFGDVRTTIQSLVPNMDLQIQNGFVVLQYDQPEPFSVESPPGDDTAATLGLVGETSPARLFDLFADVVSALEADDHDALRQTLAELEDVHANIMSQDVSIGARQSTLDQTDFLLRERAESLKSERSRVEDVDLVSAATDLGFAETAYQAALASASRIFDMSLLNYL